MGKDPQRNMRAHTVRLLERLTPVKESREACACNQETKTYKRDVAKQLA